DMRLARQAQQAIDRRVGGDAGTGCGDTRREDADDAYLDLAGPGDLLHHLLGKGLVPDDGDVDRQVAGAPPAADVAGDTDAPGAGERGTEHEPIADPETRILVGDLIEKGNSEQDGDAHAPAADYLEKLRADSAQIGKVVGADCRHDVGDHGHAENDDEAVLKLDRERLEAHAIGNETGDRHRGDVEGAQQADRERDNLMADDARSTPCPAWCAEGGWSEEGKLRHLKIHPISLRHLVPGS